MFCGSGDKFRPDKNALDQIRNMNNMDINMNINKYQMKFDSSSGKWNTNLNDMEIENQDDIKANKDLKLKKEEFKQIEAEILRLEKEYQIEVSKLLVVTKTVKTQVQNLFDEMGVSHEDHELIEKKKIELANRVDESVDSRTANPVEIK